MSLRVLAPRASRSPRRLTACTTLCLATALGAPLAAGAGSWTDAHAPRASWTDSHAPHASWTDSRAARTARPRS